MSARVESKEAVETILGFVRGEESWSVLERAGIHVGFKDDAYEIDNPRQWEATAGLQDVARGLLVHRRTPDPLRRWAGIILAGSSFLGLGVEFETTPEGDLLLNALWDAAFGDEVSQEAVRVAEEVLGRTDDR